MCGAERLAAAEPRGVSRRGRRVLCDRYRNLIPAPNWTPSHILKGGHKVTAVACSAGPAPRTAPRALPARRLLSFLPREPRPALPARLPASPPSPETALSMTRATECCRPSNNGAANCLWHRTQRASLRCSRRPSARRTGRGEGCGPRALMASLAAGSGTPEAGSRSGAAARAGRSYSLDAPA